MQAKGIKVSTKFPTKFPTKDKTFQHDGLAERNIATMRTFTPRCYS
jgi:hypothetical protein